MMGSAVPQIRIAILSVDGALCTLRPCISQRAPCSASSRSFHALSRTNQRQKSPFPMRTYATAPRNATGSTLPTGKESPISKQQNNTLHQPNTEDVSEPSPTSPVPAQPERSPHEPAAPIPPVTPPPTPNDKPSPSTSSPSSPAPSRKTKLSKPTPPYHPLNSSTHPTRSSIGTVTRTSTMSKTVSVTTQIQRFDRFLRKHYTKPSRCLVHDPNEILVEGDVIEYGLFPELERRERIERGKGKRVKFVVRSVVTPFGVGLEERRPKRREGAEQGRRGRGRDKA